MQYLLYLVSQNCSKKILKKLSEIVTCKFLFLSDNFLDYNGLM